jgi:predicted MFS family arabinose efflux permease
MALACGLGAANLYYAQPLLDAISNGLGVGAGPASAVVTAAQVGYGLGLVFVVPLGDLLDRRRLVVWLLLLCAPALAAAALAPSLAVLAAAVLCAGTASVAVQVLVPFAASLAGPEERGRAVAGVMTGLLLGILLARTLSGAVAAIGGWRSVFGVATFLMLGLAALMARELPSSRPAACDGYLALLRSVARIAREEPVVRRRAAYGAAGFGAFSAFWTALAFLLAGPPYNYGEGVIGLFGLLGVAGVLIARVAGRAADAGRTRAASGLALAGLAASFAVIALGGSRLWALMLGAVLLDVAVQANQILNQSEIYRARPDATSRVTTIYMASIFVGGAVCSLAAGALWSASGWNGVCALGAGLGLVALAGWLTERPWSLRVSRPRPEPGEVSG